MSSNGLPPNPPKSPDFTLLISKISELLRPDLEDRIRNELTSRRADAPVGQECVVATHKSLGTIVKKIGKARKDLNAIMSFFDAAEEYAVQQLNFHATFKAYVERTTNQSALRSELAAPIRRLPNEILQMIFLEVHAHSTAKERYNPITAQVCAFWRELAHATPFLWTSINANLAEEEGAMAAVDQMEARIGRARGRLVSMQLSVEGPSWIMSDAEKSPITATITTLLKHKDRLVSLRITTRGNDRLGGDLAKRCEKENTIFKNLRTLSLYQTGRFGSFNHFNTKPILQACPNIERLCVFNTADTSTVHWEKIREFQGPLDAQALPEFLARGRDVEQAEISSSAWRTLPAIAFSDSLTALSLGRLGEDSATSLANSVQPPSGLRYLSMETAHESLMDSWGPGLEFLSLPNVSARNLKDLLSAAPNLQGLRITGNRPTPPNLFSLLPKLTHFELRTGNRAESEKAVRKTLARALHPTSRGKRLQLWSVTFLPGERGYYYRDTPGSETAQLWDTLSQDLNNLDIEVHDYRALDALDIYPFKTPFFVERGWCI